VSADEGEGKKKEKAKLFYLKGKILDLLPAYEKSAEEFLHKSVRLCAYADKAEPYEWGLLEYPGACAVQEGRH
jgi:hypothetical protein